MPLPSIRNTWIRDFYALISAENIWARASVPLTGKSMRSAITIEGLASDVVRMSQQTREVAAKLFDVRSVGVERTFVRADSNRPEQSPESFL